LQPVGWKQESRTSLLAFKTTEMRVTHREHAFFPSPPPEPRKFILLCIRGSALTSGAQALLPEIDAVVLFSPRGSLVFVLLCLFMCL
jgi:hypothetical protein